MSKLSGKVALVTGGSRGIGRATAMALSKAGARLIVHYSQSIIDAEYVVDQIRKEGGEAEALKADLARPEGAHELAAAVCKSCGDRLDILVANAGMGKEATPIEETAPEDFDRLYAVNVRAPFFLVQQLLPVLRSGTSVILLSSLAAHAAVGALPAYACTKGAINTLVKHFASALGPRGIRVNAVAPGVIATDMTEIIVGSEAGRSGVLEMQALKRIAEPKDIASIILFLASDDARWITGDIIHVDRAVTNQANGTPAIC